MCARYFTGERESACIPDIYTGYRKTQRAYNLNMRHDTVNECKTVGRKGIQHIKIIWTLVQVRP